MRGIVRIILLSGIVATASSYNLNNPGGSVIAGPIGCTNDEDCDDGLVCNGFEYCDQAGFCAAGMPATCCNVAPTEVCMEGFGRCTGDIAFGQPCVSHEDCPIGCCNFCLVDCRLRFCDDNAINRRVECMDDADCPGGRCPTPDENCDDRDHENGIESCDATTGSCRREFNPPAAPNHGARSAACFGGFCGDNIRSGAEECDGTDDELCPGACFPPGDLFACFCGKPGNCGDGTRNPSEECDPGNAVDLPGDFLCPGACRADCTCDIECGNDIKEGHEECDGLDDNACPGRCLADCLCPPPLCGDGLLNVAEQCDGLEFPCDIGECRPPGDPMGECTCACASCPPLPAGPNPTDPLKCRFVSFLLPNDFAGLQTAIRIKLVSLHNPSGEDDSPDFSQFDGKYRFFNTFRDSDGIPVLYCPDSLAQADYPCVRLGCAAEIRDWGTDFEGRVIHVTGAEVVPSSVYEIEILLENGVPLFPIDPCEGDKRIGGTGLWGDVASVYGIVNVVDVAAIADKIKDLPNELPEYRLWLRDNFPNPMTGSINVLDLSFAVEGIKEFPYPFPGPAPCP